MALTVTLPGDAFNIEGDKQTVHGTLAFDSSYPTGGETLQAKDVGLRTIEHISIYPRSGYVFDYDYTNEKVLAYLSAGTISKPAFVVQSSGAIGASMEVGLSANTDAATFEGGTGITALRTLTTTSPVSAPTFTGTAGTEVAAATDLSTLTGVRFVARGI